MTLNQNIPPSTEGLIRLILLLLAITWVLAAQSQSIVIAGPIANADTTNITVWSNGELVLQQQTTDQVYALILGQHPHYTIAFECFGTTKYAILITDRMKEETIRLPVDFNVRSNVILTKEKSGFLSPDPITYRYYGGHSFRKKF